MKLFLRSPKPFIIVITGLFLISSIFGAVVFFRVKTQVREMFQMNRVLQEEGYYMAEFEFKMLGIVYYLDKGRYLNALSTLSEYHRVLSSKENLVKIPRFDDPKEELEFYLNLQNPRTGAFMDDSFPYCTFHEPTQNILEHMDDLAYRAGVPLNLKYPLKYLDDIMEPEQVTAFLDDVSEIGWLGNKFPQTTFVLARSLLDLTKGESTISTNKLYDVSDDFKKAVLGWFHKKQDPTTGFWGPMSRTDGTLLRVDLNNTASIVKAFINKEGGMIHKDFQVSHKSKIIETTLIFLNEPLPEKDALDEWHEWNLATTKGLNMLLRYLWNDASPANKQTATKAIERYLEIKFKRFYVRSSGAFSHYPDSTKASLDGTSAMTFEELGAYDGEKQSRLWGPVEVLTQDLGTRPLRSLTKNTLDAMGLKPGVNSIRIYLSPPSPKNPATGVSYVYYPQKTPILDASELVPGVLHWLKETDSSTGNWASKKRIETKYSALGVSEPIVLKAADDFARVELSSSKALTITAVAHDALQIPRYRMAFLRTPSPD